MILQDALTQAKLGYSIRNKDHGFQMLVPQDDSASIFRLSGTLDPEYNFTTIDKMRTDWEVVGQGQSYTDIIANPSLEAEFDTPAAQIPIPIAQIGLNQEENAQSYQ